jgi:stage III sporulation protein SpoIIIAA
MAKPNFTTKTDLSKVERGLKKDLKEIRHDHASLEHKVDTLTELVKEIPTRDDMQQMLDRLYGFSTMKAEHERMKKIMRERLNVEI